MANIDPKKLWSCILDQRSLAEEFFGELARTSRDEPGVTRASYGEGENIAHDLLVGQAHAMGLSVSRDAAANTYVRWQGAQPEAPEILLGSHLDSVLHGGNFDGAAGVVAGLVAIAALRALDVQPSCNVGVIGVRAEESAWFQVSYIGSRSALGTLPQGALESRRVDTGRTLAEHMAEAGGDPQAIHANIPCLDPTRIRAFLEAHIEQAPSLVESNVPIGICTGIPGNFRYPDATVRGEYNHVGLPRRFRRDAVVAACEMVCALDRLWEEYDRAGRAMACTLGRFHTDFNAHSLTMVPGELRFSLDVRAYDEGHLKEIEERLLQAIEDIEHRRGVTFDLGRRAGAAVGVVDSQIRDGLAQGARALGIDAMSLGSPASHDAGAFAAAGVPTGMLLVRNYNGSHNPGEDMRVEDLLRAAAILAWWVAENVGYRSAAEQ